jgi:hypothetical protein
MDVVRRLKTTIEKTTITRMYFIGIWTKSRSRP